jgi:hypothetical protein
MCIDFQSNTQKHLRIHRVGLTTMLNLKPIVLFVVNMVNMCAPKKSLP